MCRPGERRIVVEGLAVVFLLVIALAVAILQRVANAMVSSLIAMRRRASAVQDGALVSAMPMPGAARAQVLDTQFLDVLVVTC
jgi:hypothetical protein